MSLTIRQAAPSDLPAVRELFLEYANSLGFSLCFQSFDKELASLPGDYAPPEGRLLIAEVSGAAVGCVALHKLAADMCEMKRLFVRPAARGLGAGRALVSAIINEARAVGYRAMRLDTVVGVMDEAITLYRRLGFRQIAPYRENPVPGAIYLELELTVPQIPAGIAGSSSGVN